MGPYEDREFHHFSSSLLAIFFNIFQCKQGKKAASKLTCRNSLSLSLSFVLGKLLNEIIRV